MGKSEINYYVIDEKRIYIIESNTKYDRIVSENPKISKRWIEEFFIINDKVCKYNEEIENIEETTSDVDLLVNYIKSKDMILEEATQLTN